MSQFHYSQAPKGRSVSSRKPAKRTSSRPGSSSRSRSASKPAGKSSGSSSQTSRPARRTNTNKPAGAQSRRPAGQGRHKSSGQGGRKPGQGGQGRRKPQGRHQGKGRVPVRGLRRAEDHKKPEVHPKVSKISKNELRVIVVGGVEEVGRNMTLLEYGDEIVIVDCGLQFGEEDMPGIDYIIPNISYLRGKEKNVKGMVISHAHLDHIGGIPHIAPKLNNPPIYGTKLTLGIVEKRQDDWPGVPKLDLRPIEFADKIKLGKHFEVEFVNVNHNIPDSIATVIRTPEGVILHTGDFKFDWTPIIDPVIDVQKLGRLGEEGVLMLMSDSTNAGSEGHQLSESVIGKNLETILRAAEGRIIVGSFGSLLMRVQQVIWIAEKLGRKVVIQGYSMRTNVEIAKKLGYMKFKDSTLVSPQVASKLPKDKYIIMTTGAQGEENAGLMRIATREHKWFQIEKGDTVIFSSSVVPGNERTVQRLTDTLHREGAHVINYKMMDVHAGGHAMSEDLKLLYRLVKPKYIAPIEGNLFMLKANAKVALGLGYEEKDVFVARNGQVMSFKNGSGALTKEYIPTDYVMVDGLGVGDVSHVVLRDRQLLSEDGMVVVIATVKSQTGELVGNPDIISRGFVYMKSSKKLIDETRKKAAKILEDKNPKDAANPAYLKNKIRDELGQFIFQKTQRQPMILPVIIEV